MRGVDVVAPSLLDAVHHVQGIVHAQSDEDGEGRDDHRRQGQVQEHRGAEGHREGHHDRQSRDDDDFARSMQCGDDADGEQQREGKHVQQIVVDFVADVFEHFGQAGDGHVRAVEVSRTVVNDVLNVLQKFCEVVEIRAVEVVVQANHNGRSVPDAVAVEVVGRVTVFVAVKGRIKVVGVPDHGGEGPSKVVHQRIDAVLVGNRVGASTWQITIEADRNAGLNAVFAHGVVEAPVRGVGLFDELCWREDPEDAVLSTSIVLVPVDASAGGPRILVLVVALDPRDFAQDGFVGDVVAQALAKPGVVRLDVDDGDVGRPFLTYLKQQIR